MKTEKHPQRVRLARSVRARLGAERGFLFEERMGRVYSLSGTAAFAVARLQEHPDLDDLIARLRETFDVDAETVQRDLAAFVEQLMAEGLATVDGDGTDG